MQVTMKPLAWVHATSSFDDDRQCNEGDTPCSYSNQIHSQTPLEC